MSGLKFLYNLILKDAVKGSGQASGILSIGSDVRKIAMNKYAKYVNTAKKQGVDLDKLSEQEIKYMMELNKPKAPRVFSNEEAYKFLNQFLNQGKKRSEVVKFPKDKIKDVTKAKSRPPETEIIKGIQTTRGLGDLFPKQLEKAVTVRTVIEDIKKLKPIESMKETNRVLRGEGKYKNLSKADREKIAGDESVTDHIFERNIEPDPEDFAGGGVAGMLGEPTYQDEEHRVPYSKGGSTISDVLLADFDELDNDELVHIIKLLQAGEIPKFADGGRIGFSEGKGPKMSRRNFLKIMGGLAALPVVGKLFKFAKPAAKAAKVADVTSVPIKNIEGMPAWFKPLVNKVIKEGTEIPSGAERVIVHKTKLPNSKTEVYVNQDLNTGDVTVDLGMEKHGFQSGKYGQPVRLEYKASEVIEPTHVKNIKRGSRFEKTGKPQKTKEEFWVEEAEFTGGHPENVKFEESTIEKFGNHASDFSEVESFATGKSIKEIQKTKRFTKDVKRNVSEVDWKPTDDYASGGRVPRSGGGIMKLLKTFFKKKPETLRQFLERRNFLKLMIGNTTNMKNKRILQEILEENKKVKGYEFPESGIGSDIHKEIETILSKDITKHANGGLAGMLGE